MLSAAFDFGVELDLDLLRRPIAKPFCPRWYSRQWYSGNLSGIAGLHIFKQS